MFITEQQLEGQHVRLETLSAGHIEALAEAVRDGEGWGLWYASVPEAAYVERAMEAASHGGESRMQAFDAVESVRSLSSDRPRG